MLKRVLFKAPDKPGEMMRQGEILTTALACAYRDLTGKLNQMPRHPIWIPVVAVVNENGIWTLESNDPECPHMDALAARLKEVNLTA